MNDLVLGIESSCDDTGVALVKEDGTVLTSLIATQADIHAKYGGVYPEFASRAHIASILPVVEETISSIGITSKELKAIGVTRGPGLIGSLLVGLNTAAGLGLAWGLPVIGVNHLRGHLRSADLDIIRTKYPAIILLVSGGHTLLAYMADRNNITLLGSTRDDSVGEAYDKVARMLGLNYPGGAAVDKLAMKGESKLITFPRPMLNEGLEFSFSGLKTAVSRYLNSDFTFKIEDVAASFVDAAMEVLLTKCHRALLERPSKSLVVVGGVAASPQLRSNAKTLTDNLGIELCLPPLQWSTDNAAMIALATFDYINIKKYPKPIPQLKLSIGDY
jgi:N6-L-threonylcarbamoyladenine synthase